MNLSIKYYKHNISTCNAQTSRIIITIVHTIIMKASKTNKKERMELNVVHYHIDVYNYHCSHTHKSNNINHLNGTSCPNFII